MVQNRKKHRKNSHLIIHFPTSEGVFKWSSAAERASKASSAEQANKWAVRANEQADERVAQYLQLDSWLFWTIELIEICDKTSWCFRIDWECQWGRVYHWDCQRAVSICFVPENGPRRETAKSENKRTTIVNTFICLLTSSKGGSSLPYNKPGQANTSRNE